MRNLKRVLSLALAALMLMGMMVVGAGAASKDFTDSDEIKNVEAVDVMVALGVLEGGDKGDFQPNSILTREQAAKIICYLLLGEENAEKLTTNYSIFSDVPANRWSAPYISYCVNLGILAGDGAGHFYPEGKLTGVAFAKMLLVCLGYSAERENYVGNNWEINTSAAAIAAGVAPKALDLSKELSRQDAAQMAFNTLTATMVEYLNDNTIIIGGETIISTTGKASAVKQYPYEDTMDAENLQFAEKYFGKLKKLDDVDAFDRPAHTWSYKGEAVGTYVNWDMMVAEYTASVTGKELYNVLTASTIKEYGFTYYVDGTVSTAMTKDDLYRNNNKVVGATGNGVLTQVFVDNDNEEIVITSINTYLAVANSDYNSKSETISLQVYNTYANGNGVAKVVDADEVPAIVDLKEGDFVLVNWAGDKDDAKDKDIVIVSDVAEVKSDVTVSKFSKSTNDDHDTQNKEDRVTSVTVDGQKYSANKKAFYEYAVLGDYDADKLTNKTYDIYMDQYGYFIGVALHSGQDQYVFVTAYDVNKSAMGTRNADALAIFTDGTMKEITVNTKDTNKNIDTDDDGVSEVNNYAVWDSSTGCNRWFTYTEDNGVYTLKPATRYTINSSTRGQTIQTDRLSLNHDIGLANGVTNAYEQRSFGNDKSIYITVEQGTRVEWGNVMDEVTGMYTGVDSVRLLVDNDSDDYVYAVYDKDNYIIAAIVVGEAEGAVDNYAYILSGAHSEGKDSDGYYYWTFDAVLNGQVQEMTIKTKYSNTINNLYVGEVQELVLDADGYVTKINRLDDANNANHMYNAGSSNKVYDNADLNTGAVMSNFAVYHVAGNKTALYLDGRTLHLDNQWDKDGLFFGSDAKAVVRQTVNDEETIIEYSTVKEAYSTLSDCDDDIKNGLNFDGYVVAVLDANGVAKWVFFDDLHETNTGDRPDYGNNGKVTTLQFYAAGGAYNNRLVATNKDGGRVANAVIVLEKLDSNGYVKVGTFTTSAAGNVDVPVVTGGTYRATCGNVEYIFTA